MALISGSVLLALLGTILCILAGVYLYFKHVFYNYWKKRGVVCVEPTIPMGNLGSLLSAKISPGELFGNAYKQLKHNRYIGMYIFHKPTLLITDLELVKDVLVRGFANFHDRGLYCNEELDPMSGNLFFLPGAKWRNLRTKMTPTFTSGKIRQMFGMVTECGDRLALHLKPKAENREDVEIKDLFARFGTDVITSTAFGINCNSLEDPENEYRHWGRKVFEPKAISNVLTAFGGKIAEFFAITLIDKEVSKFFMHSFRQTVEYRRENKVTRHDFVDLLIQLMNKGHVDIDETSNSLSISETADGKITMTEAAAQAFVFFLGGFETTGTTLSFCIYELAKNQDIQEKVRADIDAALERSNGLTYEAIEDMPYLRKVIAETLRMYPPFPLLNRQCNQDMDLPTTNLRLTKNLDIVIPIYGIHRDPEIYPEPEKFDPERFNQENTAARHPFAYLPFGEGPRNCIGKRFAYVNVKVALVSVLSKYRVSVSPTTPLSVPIDPGNFVLVALGGIHVRFEPR